MVVRQPRYSKEEFARRGQEIYNRDIRPQIEAGNKGKIVAIDIETGAYEMAEDTVIASERLFHDVYLQLLVVTIARSGTYSQSVTTLLQPAALPVEANAPECAPEGGKPNSPHSRG